VINGTHDQNEVGDGIWETHVARNSDPIEFTVKNGAKQPDLVAAMADNTCASSQNFTFDVLGTLNVSRIVLYNGRSSCAVLPTPMSTPSANPCGAKLNSSAAEHLVGYHVLCNSPADGDRLRTVNRAVDPAWVSRSLLEE
jgi:hypothetical protein